MTLKQLEAFFWAAKLGSFSVAASRLHVTQSSLSKRIAELEDDLGKALFDRTGQRAVITDAGERLLEHASQMLDIEGRIRAGLDMPGALRGTCRFGISELVASTWFPGFVARVRELHPNLVLEPQVDLALRLERRLERGELDFAIIPGPSPSPGLANEKVGELEYGWMASPQRLPKGTVLTPRHFVDHPVITLSAEAGLSRAFEQWAAEQRLEIPRALVCNSLTALIALAVSGVGISFFPRVYVQPFLRADKLVELACARPLHNLSYHFHWRAGDTRSVVRSLREITLEAADFSMDSPLWPETAR
ncbi:LysR family transcriptional regulator [Cupriavidus basilensis]|uniref:LysR family transcriptional regulator n=1 Tax=Cupriavidus basilensis TaxID=68895 RepID=A0ABT6B151_9BURK|nr:LysR family transcriptional regulator [Cupriavidus basilensis]MDF3838348.1 LysR family transcriptional regulator [Cupriavidus basilensis]